MAEERSSRSTLRNLFVYGLLFAGLALLIAGRAVPEIGGSFWAGVALLLMAGSCFAEALLPGGAKLAPEQVVMLSHLRIRYRSGLENWMNAALGALLLGVGLWLMFG
jgi:glucose dehydrogenase